jgi:hypothetical protein
MDIVNKIGYTGNITYISQNNYKFRRLIFISAKTVKCKAVPLHDMQEPGWEEYSSYSFLTWAVEGVSGQRHAQATLYPGKDLQYPLDRSLGGPQDRS